MVLEPPSKLGSIRRERRLACIRHSIPPIWAEYLRMLSCRRLPTFTPQEDEEVALIISVSARTCTKEVPGNNVGRKHCESRFSACRRFYAQHRTIAVPYWNTRRFFDISLPAVFRISFRVNYDVGTAHTRSEVLILQTTRQSLRAYVHVKQCVRVFVTRIHPSDDISRLGISYSLCRVMRIGAHESVSMGRTLL